jgi:TonB family protein
MKKRVYLTALYLSACAGAQAQGIPAPPQMVVPRASDGNGRGVDTTKVYDVVERMPALPTGGGSRAIVQALQQAVGWPVPGTATQRVVVEFIVDRTGRARQARLLKATSPTVDEAVLTAVDKLPAFTPGTQKGEAVYVRFRVPVLVSPSF